jgi:hypothetical protein
VEQPTRISRSIEFHGKVVLRSFTVPLASPARTRGAETSYTNRKMSINIETSSRVDVMMK